MRSSVKNTEDTEGTVRLDSFVEIHDLHLDKRMVLHIVLPDLVDLRARRISVFAPLSTALLGRKAGETVSWQSPAEKRLLRILRVSENKNET